jgi:GTP cyclohydrolase II
MTIQPQENRFGAADLRSRARVVAARSVLASGGLCRIDDRRGAVLVQAVDGLDPKAITRAVRGAGGTARLVLTGPRAQILGLAVPMAAHVALRLPQSVEPELLSMLSTVPSASAGKLMTSAITVDHAREAERAGIELAKRAGLLPVVLVLPDDPAAVADADVTAAEIFAQRERELASLEPVVETRLPIAAVEETRLVVFRSAAGGSEQVALLIGRPEQAHAPLCRLHSECLTGDLFGSLRCDCGEQLDGAIGRMAEEGAGILLYLRQEGRGIGLVNKLRAYRLQDEGLDTVDANTHLGFQADERDFAIAAAMLKRLGTRRIRLLTNNPDKIQAVEAHGVAVEERVPLTFAANRHNRFYLETKARKSGHLLRVIEGGRANGWGDGRDGLARALLTGTAGEIGV